jgi:hypothetical protein
MRNDIMNYNPDTDMYPDYRSVLEEIRDTDNGGTTVQGKSRRRKYKLEEDTKNGRHA